MNVLAARLTPADAARRCSQPGAVLAVVVCAISVLVAGSRSSSSSSMPGDAAARLQQALDDAGAEGGFPGVVAGVWAPEGSWLGASGTKGRDDAPPRSTDRTRIGSVTKTMTVTVLLQLVEEGKVSLDDTVGSYGPGIANADSATLRQLANMTSGIPGNGVLRPETQQFRRGSIDQGNYGLGIAEKDGWWGHTGEIFGYTTVVLHNYQRDATVIVVVNTDVPPNGSDTDPASAVFNKLVSVSEGG